MGEVIRPGDALLVRTAYDEWLPATASSAVEGIWKDGRKVHDFPVVLVQFDGAAGSVPWPLEDVRRRA